MTIQPVSSFACGAWVPPGADARPIENAVTGEIMAQAGDGAINPSDMLAYARDTGGPALRRLTFHDRARMLKALAAYLNDRKQTLYDISYATGATTKDHAFDIDGGIGTTFVFASKGRREMPDQKVFTDGDVEELSRNGSFKGVHICAPMTGVALHINAFNFPLWGMLEKLAPTILAGMPAIVKPATSTSYVTEAAVRMILEADILPPGALQLVAGGTGDIMDHMGTQDALAFTGSAATAATLRAHPAVASGVVRFTAEQDSLNASILGPDAAPGTPEFDLFAKEVLREMTTKAGQKCTAIRRILVPRDRQDDVIAALSERLAKVRMGDPRDPDTRIGALVSSGQRADVLAAATAIGSEATLVHGDPDARPEGLSGAFCQPLLFHCTDPDAARIVHEREAFGPVSTVMGYRDLPHAIALANRGGGSLVTSLITHDGDVAREVTLGVAPWHGRVYINDRTSMKESTGHGAPMPHMVHGGPGRAGGGEELGGIRGVKHYMQRTAVQGSPAMLSRITGAWVPNAPEITGPAHPFTRRFDDLAIGETHWTDRREISMADIEHFAHFTGDTFYAHMDEAAAQRNPFFAGRVAHGYLILSFAAGLFVEPNEGPVLANTGLDGLRFMKPLTAGNGIRVRLTVKKKTPRVPEYGEVRWHVTVLDDGDDLVAEYELLTMVAR